MVPSFDLCVDQVDSPPVLVPGFDLCVGQVEAGRHLHPVLHTQVFLTLEVPFQRLQLVVGEGCPGFPRLLRLEGAAILALCCR